MWHSHPISLRSLIVRGVRELDGRHGREAQLCDGFGDRANTTTYLNKAKNKVQAVGGWIVLMSLSASSSSHASSPVIQRCSASGANALPLA